MANTLILIIDKKAKFELQNTHFACKLGGGYLGYWSSLQPLIDIGSFGKCCQEVETCSIQFNSIG